MPETSLSDRAALADLAANYSVSVDHGDYGTVAALFVPDGRLVIHRPDQQPEEIKGAHEIARKIETARSGLLATSHFLGQQLAEVDGDHATAETYCTAQHISEEGGERWNRVMNIRYVDECVREAERWRFLQRTLMVDWVEYRPVGTPPASEN